jgi:hypothetical protein
VRVTRRQVEQAFVVHIGDYQLGSQRFYANDTGPSLPANLASGVEAVIGLNNDSRRSILCALVLSMVLAASIAGCSGSSSSAPGAPTSTISVTATSGLPLEVAKVVRR